MKSMCQDARRNSPSVADWRPTSSCLRTTSRIASFSISRSSVASIRPSAWSSRAFRSCGGRSRLPTWSARNGGFVRAPAAGAVTVSCSIAASFLRRSRVGDAIRAAAAATPEDLAAAPARSREVTTRLVAVIALLALCAGSTACGGREASSLARRAAHVHFADSAVGVRGTYPVDWDQPRAVTGFVDPREVLVLATYPLRGGAEAGECALDRGDLEEGVSCFLGPSFSTTFRAADRPFQLLVAFGGRPTDARLAEVRDILDSLAFDELPPPPPDPYAGWPLVHAEPGDSLRPPPGWPAAAALVEPGETPRPRPLFFAANAPLAGLPSTLSSSYENLPRPFPEEALADGFPREGVLLWVVEERPGDRSAEVDAIDREWPQRDDFEPAEPPIRAGGELGWLRARGSWYGYRFAIWIAAGPDASSDDRDLALKAGASLEVSGCFRDSLTDCPDR